MARYTTSGTKTTISSLNTELEKIAFAEEGLLSRKGESPNQMESDLDMNSNRILNLAEPVNPTEPLRLKDLEGASVAISVAEDYLDAAISAATDPFDPKSLQIIAHRGFRNVDVQNTMLAFSKCARLKAQVIEADLQVTSDGVVVVYHDATLDTLTDGTGSIASNTLAQVQAARFIDLAGTDIQSTVRIPTFGELLSLCQRHDHLLSVEIKGYRTQADINLMIDTITEYGFIDKIVISSFQYTDALYARAYNSSIRVGFIGGSTDPLVYEPLFDGMAADGIQFVIFSSGSFIGESQTAEYARSKGLKIQAYTIRDVEDVEVCLRKGIYALISDVPLEHLYR